MVIEIFDPVDKGFGILDSIRDVLAYDVIVSCTQHFIRDSEVEAKLPICQDDMIGLVDRQNAINRRLRLCLQQGGLEQQRLLNSLTLRDVAYGGQQCRPPAQSQSRQAHLSRKHTCVLALVEPLETLLPIQKRRGNPL